MRFEQSFFSLRSYAVRWLVAGACLVLAMGGAPAIHAKKYDVGGYRLHAVVKGKSGPFVVFDSGMGDSYEVWQWIWPELYKESRVFLYDRAGLGRSEAGPKPRSSKRIVTELHELLGRAGAEAPYILVGHSFGGLNMRLFAGQYPDEVAGLVLVDATPLDYPTLEDSLRTEVEQSRLETAISLGSITLRLERESVVESAEQVRDGPPLPDIPVIVVTSGRNAESARFRETWLALQEEMADQLEADRHIITENASHNIHMDQPELILEAIREVIELAGD